MDILYAPWRKDYFNEKKYKCVFCDIVDNKSLDNDNKVVYRNNDLFVVMNKFPYTPGHILIVPNVHVDSPEKLPKDIWGNIFDKAYQFVDILYKFGADGINIGMNIKSSGGAGIPSHLHLHLLPRYSGDVNFLTTIANTRAYGVNFDDIYLRIKSLADEVLY